NARRLRGQARMVTMGGELFEKAGSITGGHDSKSKLHFHEKSETDLGALRLKAKALADDVRWLQDNLKELVAGQNDERVKLKEASAVLAQQTGELEGKRKEAENLEKEIENVKPRLKDGADEIEQIDQEVTQINASLKEVEKEIDKWQEELSEVTSGGKGAVN